MHRTILIYVVDFVLNFTKKVLEFQIFRQKEVNVKLLDPLIFFILKEPSKKRFSRSGSIFSGGSQQKIRW